ncbi:MAG: hypothetical protein JWQ79_342 [Mucilaginibacter sp.]|jgi:hypothetical protein|nr:hypothetical protein [Mucilaginibacter sp.]
MRKCVLLLFVVILIATACYAAIGASGRWSGTIALLYDVTLNMKEDNGKVSGVVTTEIGDIPLNNGVITGNDIVFKPFTYNGFAVSYVKGKIDGDKMDVTIGFQGTSFQGTLKRIK